MKKFKDKLGEEGSKPKKTITFNLIEVIIMIMISILFGGIMGSFIVLSKGNTTDEFLEEFYATYDDITHDYYKKLDKKELVDAAIEGMVNYLDDPYSTFMNKKETEVFNQTVDGEYKGIGVTIGIVDGKTTILAMFDSSPAKKAGIKIGDVLIKVNGQSVEGKSTDKIVELIKKQKKVKLTVLRDEKEHTFDVSLDDVVIPSVSSEVIEKNQKKVGKISVSVFAANTYSQFDKELTKLEKEKIDSLVVDVRDNPGGHLTQVSKVLSLFLGKDKVIYQIKSNKKKTKYYAESSLKRDYKVAVLINKSSASASEILAGAMKESYGATIVGVTSYGKGTVQKEYSLSTGSSIKYTTEEWLTPKGNSINKRGIKPDVEVELSDEYKADPKSENDNQLQTALDILTK